MANCLDEASHVLFIFFTIFGLSFEGLSIAYLINLDKIDKPHACLASLMTLSDPTPDLTEPCRVHMASWKKLAVIGIIYGVVYILAAFFQLGRSCSRKISLETQRSSLKPHAEEKISQIQQHFDNLQRQRKEQEETTFWTCCLQFFNSTIYFLAVMALWIVSLTFPVYTAVNLYRTDAIYSTNDGQDDITHFLALALLVFCIINFVIVVITCVAVCMEAENDDEDFEWNVYKNYDRWDSPSSTTI